MPTKRKKNFTKALGKLVAERFALDPDRDAFEDYRDHVEPGRSPEKYNPDGQTAVMRAQQVDLTYKRGLKFEQGPKLAAESRKKTNAPSEAISQWRINWSLRAKEIRRAAEGRGETLKRREIAEMIQSGEDGGEPSDCAVGTIENAIKRRRRT